MALKESKKRQSDRAVSPAISTVIITGVMVALITVALAFASNFLLLRMAESEFNSAKQFMQTLGLQLDDVAWVIGRTETVRYSSRHGHVTLIPALNYTIYVNTTMGEQNKKLYTSITNIICFNMPVEQYSVGNDYFESIYPSFGSGFVLSGTSVPVAKVFAVEKLPMNDGSFIRVVVVPTIRMIRLSIGDTNYTRLYLPILEKGETPGHSQSVTLTGISVNKLSETLTGIKVRVSFPQAAFGFDSSFFNFSEEETISVTDGTVLELYVGGVDGGLGVHA